MGEIEGTLVLATGGETANDVRVRLTRHPSPETVILTTDDEGRFRGELRAGQWGLSTMTPRGYQLVDEEIDVVIDAGSVTQLGAVAVERSVYAVNLRDQGDHFQPFQIVVGRGAIVRWTVEADGEHEVRLSSPRTEYSGPLSRGDEFELVFPDRGTFVARCAIHDRGSIIVVE